MLSNLVFCFVEIAKNVTSRQIQTTIALVLTVSTVVLIIMGRGPFTPMTLKMRMVASLTAVVSGIFKSSVRNMFHIRILFNKLNHLLI